MRRTNKTNIIRQSIINYVESNAKTFIIITIMFLIGLVLGIISINKIDENGKNQVINYIQGFIENVKENSEISSVDVLKNSIKNNLYITIILWFLGSTIIGMPLIFIVIIYKGYSIGYSLAAVIATLGIGKGVLFIIPNMVLKYILYIPCILTIAVSGIKLYKVIIEDRRRENIRVKILQHTFLSLMAFCILIISSIIESSISINIMKSVINYL